MKTWKNKHVLFFLLLVCMIVLYGCSRTRIVDKISIAHVFGFDQADNGELIGMNLFPDYTKSKDGDEIHYIEEQAATTSLLISKMARQTSNPIEIAKLDVLLFGKGYAEKGIRDTIDRLIKTPQLGTNIQIAVSTQSAKETLNTFKKEKSFTLAQQIEHNMEGQELPNINLHIFLNHFYGKGMDAYVPMLTIDEEDRIRIDGIGIFKDDQFKLHLNADETALFSFIKDRDSFATYKIELAGHEDQRELIVVRSNQSKRKWDWDRKRKQIDLRIKLKMSLVQYPNKFNIDEPEDIEEIRYLIEEELKKGIEDLIATFKKNRVDPIGIGNIVRSKDTTWEVESFYEQYPDLPINVNVDIEIIHSGLQG